MNAKYISIEMIKSLTAQISRLFSSKKNGGKQVSNWPNRLHMFKLVWLASLITVILGMKQFRADFYCLQDSEKKSDKYTNFCLTNGTTTVISDYLREVSS